MCKHEITTFFFFPELVFVCCLLHYCLFILLIFGWRIKQTVWFLYFWISKRFSVSTQKIQIYRMLMVSSCCFHQFLLFIKRLLQKVCPLPVYSTQQIPCLPFLYLSYLFAYLIHLTKILTYFSQNIHSSSLVFVLFHFLFCRR